MEQSAELRELVRQTYEALVHGDMSFFERHLSRGEGVLMIGSDPDEWWAGYDTIMRLLQAQAGEMSGFGFSGVATQAFCEGTVGWANDCPTARLPGGVEIRTRQTAVFRREDGVWKLVVWHSSLGVPNEEVVGQELSTE